MLTVSQIHAVSAGPQWAGVTDVRIQGPYENLQNSTVILLPKEDSFASMNCDLLEGIWKPWVKQNSRFQPLTGKVCY